MSKPYLHNLTALRGIAALLVATLHFHFFLGGIVPYDAAGLVDKLYLMVDLFFVLSGFIICYVYEEDFTEAISGKAYRNFLVARLARIYPLHLMTLFAEVLIFLFISAAGMFSILPSWQQHIYRLDAIPVQLTFLQTVGIYNFDTWNAPAWSLSAEWWAYVLFPFLFLGFRKIGYQNWLFGALIAVGGWLCIEYFLSPLQPFMEFPGNPEARTLDVNWWFGTLRGIVGFLAGMVVWQLYRERRFIALFKGGWLLLGSILLSLVAMQLGWLDTITVSLFAVIILGTAYGNSVADRVFTWTPLALLGRWSFSIYIWHMVLINVVLVYFMLGRTKQVKGLLRPVHGTYPDKAVYLLVFLAAVCLLGWLSYTFLEKPTRRWLRKRLSS